MHVITLLVLVACSALNATAINDQTQACLNTCVVSMNARLFTMMAESELMTQTPGAKPNSIRDQILMAIGAMSPDSRLSSVRHICDIQLAFVECKSKCNFSTADQRLMNQWSDDVTKQLCAEPTIDQYAESLECLTSDAFRNALQPCAQQQRNTLGPLVESASSYNRMKAICSAAIAYSDCTYNATSVICPEAIGPVADINIVQQRRMNSLAIDSYSGDLPASCVRLQRLAGVDTAKPDEKVSLKPPVVVTETNEIHETRAARNEFSANRVSNTVNVAERPSDPPARREPAANGASTAAAALVIASVLRTLLTA